MSPRPFFCFHFVFIFLCSETKASQLHVFGSARASVLWVCNTSVLRDIPSKNMDCKNMEQHSNLLASLGNACTSLPSHPPLLMQPILDGEKRKRCNRRRKLRKNVKPMKNIHDCVSSTLALKDKQQSRSPAQYHPLQNNYSFDALQANCFGINIKL